MGHGKHSHMSKGPEMGHSPNEMGHSPNEMSREFKYMPAVEDMTGQRASSIINAGARSRMSGQPQMGHSPAEMGHSPMEMARPDYPDIDGDGDKEESMKKAAKDKKNKKQQ